LIELTETYGDDLRLVIHIFPLPYHTWAFVAATGLFTIQKYSNAYWLNYTQLIFANQEQFSIDNTADTVSKDVYSQFATLVGESGILDSSSFLNGITADSAINNAARVAWKYACSRGITGTPQYLLNSVSTVGGSDIDSWKAIIDPMLPNNGACAVGQALCQYAPSVFECCNAGEYCIPGVGCRC